jgi:hypothetical protein
MKSSHPSWQSNKNASANKFFSVVFSALVVGLGSHWLSSVAVSVGDNTIIPGTPASKEEQRLRTNLMKFNHEVLDSDVVNGAMPLGYSRANELNVQLAPTWNEKSGQEQNRALNDVANIWLETVKSNPVGETKPRVWFHRADGAVVKTLS